MAHVGVGRIVHYALTEQNLQAITARRRSHGFHGNPHEVGQLVPMVIVRVWGPATVNGQVLLDGNDSLWLTSVVERSSVHGGEPQPGRWQWPEIV